jgi:hypothetical protein
MIAFVTAGRAVTYPKEILARILWLEMPAQTVGIPDQSPSPREKSGLENGRQVDVVGGVNCYLSGSGQY